MTLIHRHDIDGLRAVAVLPVVAYHAGIVKVPGGFVGVDVFFVISGFLITSLLVREIEAGQFSIAKFYERRIRRIFPALALVLAATCGLGWLFSLPSELIDVSKGGIAAIFSVSNIFFWLKAGYFDGSALSQPLLHTWSLAVEEQFYIFWPLYLLLAFRVLGKRPAAWTVAVTVLSFILCVVGTYTFKDASYYLVATRGWELSIGGLVAMGVLRLPVNHMVREVLAATGLALIVGSVFLIHGDMPFPGALALPPTLGAVLIIAAGDSVKPTLVARMLSLPPVIFIGLISYSLYLWHWPIAVYQHSNALLISVGPDWVRKLAIIGVSIIVGYLSWRFVEQPIRAGRFRPTPRRLLTMSAIACCSLLLVCGVFWYKKGFPERYTQRQIELASYLSFDAKEMFRDGDCFLRERVGSALIQPLCLERSASTSNYLIMGDSHAAQLWWGLHRVSKDSNFMQSTAVGCLPVKSNVLGESTRCRELMDSTFQSLERDHQVDKLILVGRWTASSLDGLALTLDWAKLHGIKVLLVGPSVIYNSPLPRLLVRAQADQMAGIDLPWDKSLVALDSRLSELARQRGAEYFSLIEAMCNDSKCATLSSDQTPLVFDREHFTKPGSLLIAEKMQQAGVL